MKLYENQRQCDGAGSSSSSRCRVFPGTEASAGDCSPGQRESVQREALEGRLADRWRESIGRQAASAAGDQVVRETKTTVDQAFTGRAAGRRLSHRPVDLCAGRRAGAKTISRCVPSGPFGADLARLGVQSTETPAGGQRARPGSGRALAETGLAPHQKKAQRRGAHIVFLDETGFRLQPVNRRTWAPCGQTPVQRAWDRYDRLSVIGVVALSPARRRISTPFQIYDEHVRTDQLVAFVKQLRRQLQRPLIICWDRWQVHRSAARQLAASRIKNIDFEWLPAYAPELNPVEPRWSHAKFGKLANFVPDDTPELKRSVRSTLKSQSHNHRLKQSFFKAAQLTL
jgi:DDE superfamily endonuclease